MNYGDAALRNVVSEHGGMGWGLTWILQFLYNLYDSMRPCDSQDITVDQILILLFRDVSN